MQIYRAKKSLFFNLSLLGSAILPLVIVSTDVRGFMEHGWAIVPLLVPFILLFWIRTDTYYRIDGQYLHYKSAFIKGKIEIIKIRHLTTGETMWTGLKPAMATKGIIIKYNSADEIYIAPIDNHQLVQHLLEINPSIGTK